MQGDITVFGEPHHNVLELLAAKALARNDYVRAFELSDRRCRITPVPQPHSYLLRAEASFRLGQKLYAIADLDRALELSPDDAQANRRMLAWSRGERKRKAARSLLANERDVEVLRKAIDALEDQMPEKFASIAVLEESIEGWAVWNGTSSAEVSIADQCSVVSFFIEPDPFHGLSSEHRSAAAFSVARPKSATPQSLAVSIGGDLILSLRAAGNACSAKGLLRHNSAAGSRTPTVIIPIYADFSATAACLKSVLKAMQSDTFQVLLINDSTPDSRIRDYLDRFRRHPGVELLTNRNNMGFVGSVNRALETVDDGDIVLLNADTIVPPGFVGRLAAAAHASADIGTVVPLSNNGEFSSFPIANQVNDLDSYDDIVKLDNIAASVNDANTVDIPSGIGFCLYVTRACLNAVGHLSEHYQRGYLEDVDLCLRARELGFRSVCAPSVYVGHEGSRSFKSEKRSLVVRNLQILDAKFPNYRNECAAFVALDPLRPAREAIERSFPFAAERPKAIIVGDGAVRAVAQDRAAAAHAHKQSTMLLEILATSAGPVVRPIGPNGAVPQNIRFAISSVSEQAALDQFLNKVRPSRFEILDPANVPIELLKRVTNGETPYDIFVADSGLFYPRGEAPRIHDANRMQLQGIGSADNAAAAHRSWKRQWWPIARGAQHVFVPCAMAMAFASRHISDAQLTAVDELGSSDHPQSRRHGKRLGILVFRTSSDEFAAIQDLALAICDIRPEFKIVVIGPTADDQRLMKNSNIFVTGIVAPSEIDRVIRQYELDSLMIAATQPLFGHPAERAATISGLPVARFDWSHGKCRTRELDLAIDPRSGTAEIAASLLRWIGRR